MRASTSTIIKIEKLQFQNTLDFCEAFKWQSHYLQTYNLCVYYQHYVRFAIERRHKN